MKMVIDSEILGFVQKLETYRLMRSIALSALSGFGLQEYFRGVKIQGNLLFYRFSHNGAQREFIYKKEIIKQALREEYKKHIKECKERGLVFQDISCFVVRTPQEPAIQPYRVNRYKERAKGNFKINPNSRFKEYFEKMREAIRANIAKEAMFREQDNAPSLFDEPLGARA